MVEAFGKSASRVGEAASAYCRESKVGLCPVDERVVDVTAVDGVFGTS